MRLDRFEIAIVEFDKEPEEGNIISTTVVARNQPEGSGAGVFTLREKHPGDPDWEANFFNIFQLKNVNVNPLTYSGSLSARTEDGGFNDKVTGNVLMITSIK